MAGKGQMNFEISLGVTGERSFKIFREMISGVREFRSNFVSYRGKKCISSVRST